MLGRSALKTGLLDPDRQDGDPLGGAREARGERFPRAFTAGSRWAFWVTVRISVVGLIATVALIPPEQLQHVEESAAVAWPPPQMRRLVLVPPPHQDPDADVRHSCPTKHLKTTGGEH